MENQQDYILNNNQIQVILTGTFSDGYISIGKSGNSYYSTNSIHKEYLIYKGLLLGDLHYGNISKRINGGYKKDIIYSTHSQYSKSITVLNNKSIEEKLSLMDELGVALWFYDDGSLHAKHHFYNLCTHSFSREIQEDLFIPFFKNFGITCRTYKEEKKDGRIFYYLYISRYDGSVEVSKLLRKYYVKCFDYKMWSSETILKWSKVQAYLKSQDRVITPRLIGDYMKKKIVL